MVLFAMSVMGSIPSSLSPLTNLQYSNGFNNVQGVDNTRTYTFAFSLSAIGLEKEFVLSFNLMYIILLTVVIFCLIAKLIQNYQIKRMNNSSLDYEESTKHETKAHRATLVFNFAFERLFYLIGMMVYFLVIFALMLQLSDMSSDYTLISKELNLFAGVIAISILITLIAMIIINGVYPHTRLFPQIMKRAYAPVYVIYQSIFIFVLAFDYTQQYVLYILMSLSFVFLLFNIIYQPYP